MPISLGCRDVYHLPLRCGSGSETWAQAWGEETGSQLHWDLVGQSHCGSAPRTWHEVRGRGGGVEGR